MVTVSFTVYNMLLILFGIILISLSLYMEYEPELLLPIGFGAILVNMPYIGDTSQLYISSLLYKFGIQTLIFPALLLVGIGTTLDFSFLLSQPKYLFYGIAGQLGILGVFILAPQVGFDIKEAASIGILGTFNLPVAIYVSSKLSPGLIIAIAISLLIYNSMMPAVLPLLFRGLRTKQKRITISVDQPQVITRKIKVAFPILVTIVFGLLIPGASLLIGMLMLGNLLRESGLADRLCRSVQDDLSNITNMLLGITIGMNITPKTFFNTDTVLVIGLGLIAFSINIICGLLIGKLLALLSRKSINPLLCIAGLSPFPMLGHLVTRLVAEDEVGSNLIAPALAVKSASLLLSILFGGILIVVAGNIIG